MRKKPGHCAGIESEQPERTEILRTGRMRFPRSGQPQISGLETEFAVADPAIYILSFQDHDQMQRLVHIRTGINRFPFRDPFQRKRIFRRKFPIPPDRLHPVLCHSFLQECYPAREYYFADKPLQSMKTIYSSSRTSPCRRFKAFFPVAMKRTRTTAVTPMAARLNNPIPRVSSGSG